MNFSTKYILTPILFIGWNIPLISQNVINSNSGQGITGQYYLEWGLGEFAVLTNSNPDITISEGFLQPSYSGVVANHNIEGADNFKIYPNPTPGFITIDRIDNSAVEYKATITNSIGILILKDFNFQDNTVLSLANYPPGVYFLSVYNNQNSTTYKIIKQ